MTIAIPRLDRSTAAERGLTLADFLVPIRVGERLGTRVRHVVLIVAGALVRRPVRPDRHPDPARAVHRPDASASCSSAGRSGSGAALAALLLYLAIGAIGAAGLRARATSGLAVIQGASGGYLIGFVVAAAVVGRLAELGWDRRIGGALAMMAIGTAVIYAIGVPWLKVIAGMLVGGRRGRRA